LPRARLVFVINETRRLKGFDLDPLVIPYPQATNSLSQKSHFFRTCEMSDQSGSTRFPALFASALQAYEKQTGISLAEHPFSVQLLSCGSVESIAAFLQDQIPESSDFGVYNRTTTSINSTVLILSNLSTTPALDWAIDMVRQRALMAFPLSLMIFLQRFSPKNALNAGLAILLAVCAILYLRCPYPCKTWVC
jgi:hypothetical protein